MKKVILSISILVLIFLLGCKVQKDIVEPIRFVNDTSLQLSEKEQCEQQGKLWFYGGFAESGYSCIEKHDEVIRCEEGGGNWRMFSNGCVDSCGSKPRVCTQAFQSGCDCGATKCYGQEPSVLTVIRLKCINDPYEPYATPQEACEKTDGVWQKSTKLVCSGAETCKIIKAVQPICIKSPCPLVSKEPVEICGINCDSSNSIKICECIDKQGNLLPKTEVDTSSCLCPEGKIFHTDGCGLPRTGLMSIFYGG